MICLCREKSAVQLFFVLNEEIAFVMHKLALSFLLLSQIQSFKNNNDNKSGSLIWHDLAQLDSARPPRSKINTIQSFNQVLNQRICQKMFWLPHWAALIKHCSTSHHASVTAMMHLNASANQKELRYNSTYDVVNSRWEYKTFCRFFGPKVQDLQNYNRNIINCFFSLEVRGRPVSRFAGISFCIAAWGSVIYFFGCSNSSGH